MCAAAGQPDLQPDIQNRAVGEIKDQYPSARKARERLGWTAAWDLPTGLRETVSWYRELLGAPAT